MTRSAVGVNGRRRPQTLPVLTLRELNRKILTLNLIVPSVMQQPMLEVERLVQQFREACPLFEGV